MRITKRDSQVSSAALPTITETDLGHPSFAGQVGSGSDSTWVVEGVAKAIPAAVRHREPRRAGFAST
jgi:hypothetical protein